MTTAYSIVSIMYTYMYMYISRLDIQPSRLLVMFTVVMCYTMKANKEFLRHLHNVAGMLQHTSHL